MTRRCPRCSHDMSEYAPGEIVCGACADEGNSGTCRWCDRPIREADEPVDLGPCGTSRYVHANDGEAWCFIDGDDDSHATPTT